MAQKPRIIVTGTGSIGRRHARLLSKRKEVAVELCDPDPESLKRALEETGELPVHHSFEEMLESKPEMVLIASPHQFHTEQTISALEAGAHVLCEKPMSDRLDTARRVVEVSRNSGQVLVYGFSNHFNPGVLKIKEIIDSGELGEVLYVHFHVGTYGTLVNSRSRYQADMEGALLMDYVHQPDLLYWMLGRNPIGVYAAGSSGGNRELSSNPNSITLLLDYDDSLTTTIHLNYLQHPDRCHYEFIGDRGWIYYDLMSNIIHQGDGKSGSVSREALHFERDSIYEAEHQAFFDTITGKRPPESSAEDALQSMIVAEAAIRSWKSKRRVLVEQI